MVPLQGLSLEHQGHHQGEDSKRNHLLDDLQLHEVERTAVLYESYSVCGYLCAVFEEGHSP